MAWWQCCRRATRPKKHDDDWSAFPAKISLLELAGVAPPTPIVGPDEPGDEKSHGFTEFYRGYIGKAHCFATFETTPELVLPSGHFLRRLPASTTAANVVLRAIVRGGLLGSHTVAIEFGIEERTLRYLRDGKQGGWWMPLRRVRRLRGKINQVPTHIWTGQGDANTGWILGGGPHGTKFANFASSYPFSNAFDICNGRPTTGTEVVSLFYKTTATAFDPDSLEREPTLDPLYREPTAEPDEEPVEGEVVDAPPLVPPRRPAATVVGASSVSSVAVLPPPVASTSSSASAGHGRLIDRPESQFCAWVSLDPRTCELQSYPPNVAELVERAWQSRREVLPLGTLFYGAQVCLRVKGLLPFQRTERGKRDVRRLDVATCPAAGEKVELSLHAKGVPGKWEIVEASAAGAQEAVFSLDASQLVDAWKVAAKLRSDAPSSGSGGAASPAAAASSPGAASSSSAAFFSAAAAAAVASKGPPVAAAAPGDAAVVVSVPDKDFGPALTPAATVPPSLGPALLGPAGDVPPAAADDGGVLVPGDFAGP
eukprot:TRINITY_DN38639_c0_g1_i1.p1 TRINITY_DN38639_c0_g1~~TRINITY_DN38639_c0_g1_i1.p1  ORF type:complete len:540 (-),score=106.80 TRINITY_DN38639_c0_g1_i1:566-2185(-)